MKFNLANGEWLNQPLSFSVNENSVQIKTEPKTDLWQKSYYGFQVNNAPAFLFNSSENFTFTVKVICDYKELFDQCGVIVYLDEFNWFKASIEYENKEYSRLGSVVTNLGYSDWATTDISLPHKIFYRLSRRGPDFLIEYSFDGFQFTQMRIFHLHSLEDTTALMGKSDPPLPAKKEIRFGIYACSPSQSSFTANFKEFELRPCSWAAHG